MELELQQVYKNYGKVCALENVSFTLKEGVYGLLGPNGAGKSTLMNMLVSNMAPTSGTIRFNGKDIFQLGRKYRKRIGYMPQQQEMYSYFKGYQFLEYMASLKGMNKKTAKERIAYAAYAVNLQEKLGQRIGSYSGGMKQRLLIAQAILDEPDVLVLDEPTAGLDPKERVRIRNLISDIAKNKIVMIATHVVQDIEYIANELVILKNGKLICKETPDRITAQLLGKVYEVICEESAVKEFMNAYLVTNLTRINGKVVLRMVSNTKPLGLEHKEVSPSIEDYYLYEFEHETVYGGEYKE